MPEVGKHEIQNMIFDSILNGLLTASAKNILLSCGILMVEISIPQSKEQISLIDGAVCK